MISTSGPLQLFHYRQDNEINRTNICCTKCKETLPLYQFFIRGVYHNGETRYSSWCRECTNQNTRAWRSRRKGINKIIETKQLSHRDACLLKHKAAYENYLVTTSRSKNGI